MTTMDPRPLERSSAADADGLDMVLASVAALFPEPMFVVDDMDRPVWMNFAMADRMCRDNALEPDYAVEWLLSQIESQQDELIVDTSQSTPSTSPPVLVTLSDVLGRPEWLMVRVCSLPADVAALRLIALQDVTAIKRDALALSEANTVLSHALHHDFMTGLPNRLTLEEVLDAPAPAGERALAIFEIVDMEGNRGLHGTNASDRVVERLAADLVDLVDDDMMVARVAAHRLAILFSPSPTAAELETRVKQIGDAVATDHRFPTGPWQMRVRAAVAIEGAPPACGAVLLSEAEAAIAALPDTPPGNGTPIAMDIGLVRIRRDRDAHVLSALEQAMEGGQLEPFFQPTVRLSDGRVTALEAVVRWRHPENGLVPPPFFLPVARRAGLMDQLDLRVAEAAFAHLAQWRRGGVALDLSINVSWELLAAPETRDALCARLHAAGLGAGNVCFECPDPSEDRTGWDATVAGIDDLRAAGLRFAIDGAGESHTDPAVLFLLSPDMVKLSPSSVQRLAGRMSTDGRSGLADGDMSSPGDREARALKHYLAACAAIGAEVVAVGVQDPDMQPLLQACAVHHAQGHHYAHPMPAQRCTDWMSGLDRHEDGSLYLRP